MLEKIIYQAKVIRTFFITDEQYLTKRFYQKLGYSPNFKKPQSFNEKVTARMIFERNPFHTKLADKITAREIIKEKICTSYLVPLIGIYKRFDQIDFQSLPDRFVLKCNHDSGSAMICTDKSKLNISHIQTKLNLCLSTNMYYRKREWHYKDICPHILIEAYVELYVDSKTSAKLTTCRFHCFEGEPKFIEVDITDAQGVEYSNIYDTNWDLQPFKVDLKENLPQFLSAPKQLTEMVELAKTLCFKYGYSRIDFLLTQDKIYFSEITLSPNAGRMVIDPPEWDNKLGALWQSH